MKRLLIVVDYQNDFVEGSLGFPGAENLEDPIVQKIESYRDAGDEIAFTLDTHEAEYLDTQEGRILPVIHCVTGSSGHDLYGRIAALCKKSDPVFLKPTFGSAGLFEWLACAQKAAGEVGLHPFVSIELVGLVSNICVISNAVIAKTACPEVPIIVDAACTASFDAALNEKCLDVMEGLQIQVINRA
ncbi:MAG: isochorismatase family cysteine hydrolase [Raoultibacter sp.]